MKEELLRDLIAMPDICCIVGNGTAVSEGFVDPAQAAYSESDGWATVDNGSWHVHFRWDSVREVRFVEEPSFCLGGKISYGIHYLTDDGTPVVRFAVSNPYDASGNLVTDKHERYLALKAKFGR